MSYSTWNRTTFDGTYQVTGTMVNYYLVCKRKLWLFGHGLAREQDSSYVSLGKLIHEKSFTRAKKEILIQGRIKIDHTTKGAQIVIHEVKKTRAHTVASKMQLLFYLYELEKLGVSCEGQLHFRQEKRKEPVVLDDEIRVQLDEVVSQVKAIVSQNVPPNIPEGMSCKKCAYHDYCRG